LGAGFVWTVSGDGVPGEVGVLYFFLAAFFTFLTLQVLECDLSGNKLNFLFYGIFSSVERIDCIDSVFIFIF